MLTKIAKRLLLYFSKGNFKIAGISLLHCSFYLVPINREYIVETNSEIIPHFRNAIINPGAASLLRISVLAEPLLFMVHRGTTTTTTTTTTTVFYEAILCLITIVYSVSEVQVYRYVKCYSLYVLLSEYFRTVICKLMKDTIPHRDVSEILCKRHITVTICQISNYFTFIIGASIINYDLIIEIISKVSLALKLDNE